VTYSAARKSGIRRWSPRFRAVLLDGGREVGDVSSFARAEQIAGLLNGASAGNLPERVDTKASYPHYKATTGSNGKGLVLRAEWRGDLERVLHAEDVELLEEVAELLERVDPAQRVRVECNGIRWW
jgi:hypothetical protein